METSNAAYIGYCVDPVPILITWRKFNWGSSNSPNNSLTAKRCKSTATDQKQTFLSSWFDAKPLTGSHFSKTRSQQCGTSKIFRGELSVQGEGKEEGRGRRGRGGRKKRDGRAKRGGKGKEGQGGRSATFCFTNKPLVSLICERDMIEIWKFLLVIRTQRESTSSSSSISSKPIFIFIWMPIYHL